MTEHGRNIDFMVSPDDSRDRIPPQFSFRQHSGAWIPPRGTNKPLYGTQRLDLRFINRFMLTFTSCMGNSLDTDAAQYLWHVVAAMRPPLLSQTSHRIHASKIEDSCPTLLTGLRLNPRHRRGCFSRTPRRKHISLEITASGRIETSEKTRHYPW